MSLAENLTRTGPLAESERKGTNRPHSKRSSWVWGLLFASLLSALTLELMIGVVYIPFSEIWSSLLTGESERAT
jgi:hypothetical protein